MSAVLLWRLCPTSMAAPQVSGAVHGLLSSQSTGVALSGNYADLSGAPNLSAYAKISALAAVATTGKFADLSGFPQMCGTGLVVQGINPDGSFKCVAGGAANLPNDGLGQVSNGVMNVVFTDAYTNAKAVDIPDNNPIGVADTVVVPDNGLAQKLTVSVKLTNSDLAWVKIFLYDPNNTEYILCGGGQLTGAGWSQPCGKAPDGLDTSWPDPNKSLSGDLTSWVGKNPKGNWIIKVVDSKFLNNGADGQLQKWSINVQTLSNKKVQVKGDLIVDGKITVLGAPSTTDGKCPGYLIDGVCVAESGAEQSFVNAAKWCANNFKADLCTDSQTWVLRGTRMLNQNASWTNSFSDNDGGQWSEANGGTGDDHSPNSGWLSPCCYNITPPVTGEKNVGGVRVVYVRDVEDMKFREAAMHCAGMQADLCSKAEYWVLRQKGTVTKRMWASDHSDNDNTNYEKGIGPVNDNPSMGDNYGFACCASPRKDMTCPGTDVQGVCVIKVNNNGGDWNTAATDCASVGARVCSISQSAILRSAGTITSGANWTESYSDNDGNNANVGVGNAGDDHPNNSIYGYACCL